MKKIKMRKIISVVVILTLMMTLFAGCKTENSEEVVDTVSAPINVATLNGPTGMGMVKLMDLTDKYLVTPYQSPTDIVGKISTGEVDVAALPSNLAAVLYNKTQGQVVCVSPIALGVLHMLGNNAGVTEVKDLKGKTILASGQGGTPEYVLQKVLENAGLKIYEDVDVKWLANHGEVNTALLTQEGTIAMVPEPFVSTALAQGKEGVEAIFDMNSLWKEATGQELPMGVLVARKAFVEERGADLEVFLKDYQASVDFVNGNLEEAAKLIVEKGFMGKEEIAVKAIPNCHIVLFSGESKAQGDEMIKIFNETLFAMEPTSIGGKMPNEDFFY